MSFEKINQDIPDDGQGDKAPSAGSDNDDRDSLKSKDQVFADDEDTNWYVAICQMVRLKKIYSYDILYNIHMTLFWILPIKFYLRKSEGGFLHYHDYSFIMN